MSAISSAGSSSSLYQFFHALTIQSQPSTSVTGTADNQTGTQGVQHSRHHHHHQDGDGDGSGGGTNSLFQQLQSAVASALQGTQSSSSTSDPNQTIEDAIIQVLQANSVNAPSAATSGGSAANPSTSTPTGTTNANSANTDTSTRQAFFQMLQSVGVSPQQFRDDLLAALQQVQSGNASSGTSLSSIPSGVALDTTA